MRYFQTNDFLLLRSYNFLHNARSSFGAIAPRTSFRCLARENAQRIHAGELRFVKRPPHSLPPNDRKRPAPFLRQFPVFYQNSACFSSSAAHRLTPLHNLRPTRARTHARQQLFFFCLHVFTRRAQFIHSQHIKCEGFCPFAFTAFRGFAPPPWSSD